MAYEGNFDAKWDDTTEGWILGSFNPWVPDFALSEIERAEAGRSWLNTDEYKLRHTKQDFHNLCVKNPLLSIHCPNNPNNPVNIKAEEAYHAARAAKAQDGISGIPVDNQQIIMIAAFFIVLILIL